MTGSRRHSAKRIVCTAVALSAVLFLSACDWSQLGYGPDHTGFSPDLTISRGAVHSNSMRPEWTATPEDGSVGAPVVALGFAVVATRHRQLHAYDAKGSVGCSGAPKVCTPVWTTTDLGAPISSPPAAGAGLIFVATNDARLLAFDAAGIASCSGTPKTCSPRWSTPLSGPVTSSPTISGSQVFVVAEAGTSDAVAAFDATTGTPQWSATVVNQGASAHSTASPTVANGIVYAGFTGVADHPPEVPQARVLAFDAAGNTGCSGTPRTCQALWETETDVDLGSLGTPSVANGVMFASGLAFDAAGTTGCSGEPKRCRPMWSMGDARGDTALAAGVAYVGGAAYDATGVTNCSGVPKVCAPIWTGSIPEDVTSFSSIANGVVYVGARSSGGDTDARLYAFDAAGTVNCSGTPKTCQPLWSTTTGTAPLADPPALTAPAISDGRIFVGSEAGTLSAFGLERNPPTTSMLAPLGGDTVSETTGLAASATDDSGVERVEFRLTGPGVNDALLGVATASESGWLYVWNTGALADGPYTLSSVARDFVGNQTRSAPVAINVDNDRPTELPVTVSADVLPTVQVNGIVWAQVLVGNTVYATGSFTRARPAGAAPGVNQVTRSNLLAYDITTGQLLPFNHALNGEGRALAASPDGSRVYVGGSFTTVDGASHPRLAAFRTSDGSLVTSFGSGVNGPIRAITATNETVYAGGAFWAASNGQLRGRLVAYSAAGSLLGWKPSADLNVAAMVMSPDQTRVIFGGSFSAVNGSTYHSLAAADASTGVPVPWGSQSESYAIRNDGTDSGITSLTTNGTKVFVTGFNFGNDAKPGGFEGRASISPLDGTISWISDCHGDSVSAVPIGNVLYSVGHAHDCEPAGAFPETDPRTWHRALAESTYPTHANGPATHGYWGFPGVPAPTQLVWYPDVNIGTASGLNQGPWSIVGNSSYVAMGGEFTRVNGKPQQALARFTIRSLAPNLVGPEAYSGPGVSASTANAAGEVSVSWPATWDRDDAVLTYRLYRDGGTTPISTMTADSRFWRVPVLAFTDTGLAAGSTHTYRLVVADPSGNTTTTTS